VFVSFHSIGHAMSSINRSIASGTTPAAIPHAAPLPGRTKALANKPPSDWRGWTQADVVALMHKLYPLPEGELGDRPRQQQHLCSAFLAGATESQGDRLPRSSRALVVHSVQVARTLLKNRAASHASRLWHAFMAGGHAAQAEVAVTSAGHRQPKISARVQPSTAPAIQHPVAPADEVAALKLFVRQPFTESDAAQQRLIAQVLAQIDKNNGRPHAFRYLTGTQAESADTFRHSFEAETGQAFTPRAFRAHRLALLSQAQAFVNIRVGMSESSAFELCYHIFKGAGTPVLFLVWKHAPIKTTLLKDLGNLCDITYLEFEQASELRDGIADFFQRHKRDAAPPPPATDRRAHTNGCALPI
jgi:hypothetical protein